MKDLLNFLIENWGLILPLLVAFGSFYFDEEHVLNRILTYLSKTKSGFSLKKK